MKQQQIIILILSFLSSNLFAQSLATNILFEKATVVYKGRVEKISFSREDAQGKDFGISTIVEKVYKGNFHGKEIGIRIFKAFEFDSLSNKLTVNKFQIKEDNSYIFFTQELKEKEINGRIYSLSNLADKQIEGIKFSNKLQNQMQSYEQNSYLKASHNGILPFKILFQSSPVIIEAKVIEIKKIKGFNSILAKPKSGKNIKIRVNELNCICEDGEIKKEKNYLFFLTPIDEGSYLLTDRWLGVFQFNSIKTHTLEYYKKKRARNK